MSIDVQKYLANRLKYHAASRVATQEGQPITNALNLDTHTVTAQKVWAGALSGFPVNDTQKNKTDGINASIQLVTIFKNGAVSAAWYGDDATLGTVWTNTKYPNVKLFENVVMTPVKGSDQMAGGKKVFESYEILSGVTTPTPETPITGQIRIQDWVSPMAVFDSDVSKPVPGYSARPTCSNSINGTFVDFKDVTNWVDSAGTWEFIYSAGLLTFARTYTPIGQDKKVLRFTGFQYIGEYLDKTIEELSNTGYISSTISGNGINLSVDNKVLKADLQYNTNQFEIKENNQLSLKAELTSSAIVITSGTYNNGTLTLNKSNNTDITIPGFLNGSYLSAVNPTASGMLTSPSATFNQLTINGSVNAIDYKLKDNNIDLYYNGSPVSATYKPIFVTQLTSSNITFGTSLTSTNKNYISTTWLSNLTYDQEGTQPVQNRFYINVGMNYPCSAWNSVVIGTKNKINASAHLSLVNGYQNTANGIASHAEGEDTQSFGEGTHSEGYYSIASGGWSHTQGISTITKGDYSHSEGYLTVTSLSGIYSHAEGQETITSGQCSHAEGILTKAIGNHSHSEGQQTISNGTSSHAQGRQTNANNQCSHTQGYKTNTNGNYSHAEGYNTQTSNTYAHSEGFGSKANGTYSHAEGKNTKTEKEGSHAQGILTQAIGQQSHAEGNSTVASGAYSHAEGVETEANGRYSHSEGLKTFANYTASHTEGYQTKTSEDYQHVQGKWNEPLTGYQKIVGGGDSESDRKNIYTLDWNGNGSFAGSVSAANALSASDAVIGGYSTVSPKLTTSTDNNFTIQKNGRYKLDYSSYAANTEIKLYACSGIAGYTGTAELFINPGSCSISCSIDTDKGTTQSFELGPNMYLTSGVYNHCTINWFENKAKLYVIDTF